MTRSPEDPINAPPLLAAVYTARRPDGVSPARSIARRFPAAGGERLLLAVAEGIGDPPSAEAEAAEALARLEATASRTPEGTTAESVLRGGYAAAEEAVARLMRLPGSVPGSGAAMVAAVVEGTTTTVATVANLGRGTAFLVRDGELRRLTVDHRWGAAGEAATEADDGETRPLPARRPLGAGGASAPDVAPDVALEPGDALLLCSEGIVRRLGARVIAAAFEEFPIEDVPQELTNLAVQQAGAEGAAVALLRQAGGAPTAPPVPPPPLPASTAAVAGAVPPPAWRRSLPWLVLALAAIAGVIAVVGIVALTRGGGGKKATATRAAVILPGATAVTANPSRTTAAPLGLASASPGARGATPSSAAFGTPSGSATPARSSTPSVALTPFVVASLPACSGSGAPAAPCRYTTQPGDSVSAIGDRFDLTAACFQAANRTHLPVPPQAPDFHIGAGEDYAIPNAATCAALISATPTPAAAVSTAAAASSATPASTAGTAAATPAGVCTPRPGAAAPNPLC